MFTITYLFVYKLRSLVNSSFYIGALILVSLNPAYSSLRANFLVALQGMLGDEFEHFESLGSFEKASFMLGSESWAVLCLTLLRVIY